MGEGDEIIAGEVALKSDFPGAFARPMLLKPE